MLPGRIVTDIEFWVDEARQWAKHEGYVQEVMENHLFGYPIRYVDMEQAVDAANLVLGTFDEIVSLFSDV